MKTVVLFGGTGFIGTHLAQHLLQNDLAKTIYLVDLNVPRDFVYTRVLQAGLRSGRVVYVAHDLRKPIPAEVLPDKVDVAFNLAAVHREPGHLPSEYFQTNLLGAENVCAWAAKVGCESMVFTSSISPYGPSEEMKTEQSLPIPETPYGSSKLVAEKIHLAWQAGAAARKLLIIRAGVIYGPGEGGNVTRLLRSLMRGYFVYLGNRKTVKAGGYVKELCLAAMFCLDLLKSPEMPFLLVNFSFDPPASMEQMVEAIQKAGGKSRHPLSFPKTLMMGMTYPVALVERVLGIKLPINPVRVRKLVRSNNVWPAKLKYLGYKYSYTLESSFLDWKEDLPQDFST